MKGNNGIQVQVHPKFWAVLKEIQNERIKKGKEGNGELSHKRLSLTLFKRIKQDIALYDWLVNVEIDKNEI
jgi:hypothetical protein